MIWTPDRNVQQGQLVAEFYATAGGVPCERHAIMAGGLPGAGTLTCAQADGTDLARYLVVSVDAVLLPMAARGLIPAVAGLSPLQAAGLAHAEAQFIGKRIAMLALADGRNLLLDVSLAARVSAGSWVAALHAGGYAIQGVFADISIDESVRRADAAHRRGEEELRSGRGYGGRYIPPEAIRALAVSPPAPASAVPMDGTVAWRPGRSRAASLIRAYQSGELTLADLAGRFRSLQWAGVPRSWAPGLEDARDAIDDLEPLIPGTFDDVVLAYDQDRITDTDYAVLARAAASARLD